MDAEIITIGDEILIGQVIDTNSAYIAQTLSVIGIRISRITSVSDQISEIIKSLDEASGRVKLVFLTGGLGPTNDDRTKTAIEQYFNSVFTINEDLLEHIKNLLGKRGVPVNNLNTDQAKVPDKCRLLKNRLGTAPGMWLQKEQTNFIFMPGVPFEMKAIIEDALPVFRERFGSGALIHKTILTHGIAESALAKAIESWESELPSAISLAYLPSPGMVRLRLTGQNTLGNNTDNIINEYVNKIKKIIPDYIYGYDNETMESVIGDLLIKKQSSLSAAESCTGGTISSMITSVPGCSRYFKGSVIAYSNEIKVNVLHVDNQLIRDKGAVSHEVAEAMAIGVREVFQTDYSLAITGIAGPDGGTEEKPVGTVWIAIAWKGGVRSKLFRFGDERNRNISRSAYSALNELRKTLISGENSQN